MRRLAAVLALLWLLIPVCRAQQIQVKGLNNLWNTAERYGVNPEQQLEQGLSGMWEEAVSQGAHFVSRGVRTGVELLAITLICALAEGACVGKNALSSARLAGALAVTALSVNSVENMIGLGRETIGKMDEFSALLLPVVAALTAATGHASGAAVRQGATVLFTQFLIRLIDQLLIPLVYAYIAACCGYAAVGNEGLKKLGSALKGLVTAVLTTVLLTFVAYLTVSGSIAGSADAAAVKAAKMTISRTVPVVGGILSDAAESVLVGAGVLRGSVGVVGLLVVLAICIGPFLQLAIHYLTFKWTAALTGTVAEARLSGLLDSIGGAFGLVLGMTGACALLLLFSIVSAVSAAAG